MAKTKPFTNMFGSEVQVSRTQFIERWTDEAFKFSTLFWVDGISGDSQKVFNDFTHEVKELAGLAWDSSK